MRTKGHAYLDSRRGRSVKSRLGDSGSMQVATLTCGCGAVGEIAARSVLPPDIYDKKFKNRGWSVDPHVCPDCRRKTTMPSPTNAKPTPAAREQRNLVLLALEEAYDRARQTYCAGQSDLKVAAVVGAGCPPALVATVREDFFGPIGEPADIAQMRADVQALRASLQAIETRLTSLCKVHGFAVS